MAIDEFDEHEQGERVRQWLRQNGASIVLGIGAGLAALGGWNYWKGSQREHAAKAQLEFQSLLEAETRGDAAAVETAASTLRGEFAKTPYGALAALNQARDALRKGDYAAAEAALEWARTARAGVPALAALVELRLAQVKLAKGEAQAVIDVLARIKDGQYKGPVAELRGDALVALGRLDEARAAYDDALAAFDAGSPQRDFVAMKRDDVGAAPAQAASVVPAPAAAETPAKASS